MEGDHAIYSDLFFPSPPALWPLYWIFQVIHLATGVHFLGKEAAMKGARSRLCVFTSSPYLSLQCLFSFVPLCTQQ